MIAWPIYFLSSLTDGGFGMVSPYIMHGLLSFIHFQGLIHPADLLWKVTLGFLSYLLLFSWIKYSATCLKYKLVVLILPLPYICHKSLTNSFDILGITGYFSVHSG